MEDIDTAASLGGQAHQQLARVFQTLATALRSGWSDSPERDVCDDHGPEAVVKALYDAYMARQRARDNYDGPSGGEAWSGGFAENH